MHRRTWIMVLICSAALAPTMARASAPALHAVFPTGVQRGTQFELSLVGVRLADAEEILFYRDGIQVQSIAAEDKRVTATCLVDDTCDLGELPLRLRTRSGLTEIRTIQIGALPVVPESEPNSTLESAQAIALDVTVDGRITREDIDYFVIEARAGERITAEVEAMRLGRTMFDPYVAILDSNRYELSASDDSVLLMQDSVATTLAPRDGRYFVSIRHASFKGSDQSHYRLHVGRFPRPRIAFPPGGSPGESLTVELRGDAAGIIRQQVQLPPAPIARWPLFVEDQTGIAPSPVWLRVGNEKVVNEIELSGPTPTHSPVPPPVAFQGILSAHHESDAWTFTATKGQQFAIRVVGREIRSPIDAVIAIHNPDGAAIASNDDANGPDSELSLTAPSDGDFTIRIRDHLRRGGPQFVYRIEVAAREPSLRVSPEVMDRRRPQFLQAIDVARGNRFAALYRITRQNIAGPVALTLGELPAGVTSTLGSLEPDESLIPIVFESASEGTPTGTLCSLTAKIAREGGDVIGGFAQAIPLVIGPPNEKVYYETHVDKIAVALTEPAPFRIEVPPLPIPLLRSGAAALRVHLVRAEGFDGEVETRMLWNPVGVSSAGSVKIPKDRAEIDYPINAAGDAPLRTHQLVVLARADVNGADRWVSSALIPLQIGDRFVTGKLKMCALPCGGSAAMVCNLKHIRPFEGEGKLVLKGLPHGVSAEPIQVKPGQADGIFTLVATDKAPVGRRGGLFCEFTVQVAGIASTHRLAGGGVIRIDKKPVEVAQAPAKATQPVAPKTAAKPAPPKPLSRLQQLRKAAEERKAAEARANGEEKEKAKS